MSGIAERKRAYLERIVSDAERDGVDKVPLDETNGRKLWPVNYARLALGRELDQANAYLERVVFDPTPVVWKDGRTDTADWDFLGTLLLKTLLDFGGSGLLGDGAKTHLTTLIVDWTQPRTVANKDNDHVARWPTIHTENHDLMCLTIGLFREVLSGRDASAHEAELMKSLEWRMRRGWVEWHSPCYQVHWLVPALVLARHAPSEGLRSRARAAINLQMSERALLSVGGHLGGPFFRGYDKHIADDTCDAYLPVTWMTFGSGPEPGDVRAGAAFAADPFEPHPVVLALAEESASRPVLRYKGSRSWTGPGKPKDAPDRRLISYFNTPHVSMGSMSACGYSFQTRFFNVMFADDPSKSLRTFLRDAVEQTPWDKRNERGELAQHGSWLVSRGVHVEEGGLASVRVGRWQVYRVGEGLCARCELQDDHPSGAPLHVFQASDLDMHANVAEFVAALSEPVLAAGRLDARTLEGDDVSVDLADMSLSAGARPPEDWSGTLHDCPAMRSACGSGVVEITTDAGALTISCDNPGAGE